jgi:hypothetical protein
MQTPKVERHLEVPATGQTLARHLQMVRWGDLDNLKYVFDTREGGLGIGFYFAPPPTECLSAGEMSGAHLIDRLIAILPEGYTIQWVRGNVGNMRRAVTAYFEHPHLGTIPEALLYERATFVKQAQDVGLPDPREERRRASIQQGYVFIHSPNLDRYSKKWFVDPRAYRSKELMFIASIEAAAKVLGQYAQVWQVTPSMMANYVVGFLNPRLAVETDFLPKVTESDLPDAIASMIELDDIDHRGFSSSYQGDKTYFRVVSMMWQPKSVVSGLMKPVVDDANDCTSITSIRILPQSATAMAIKVKKWVNAKAIMPWNEAEVVETDKSLGDALTRHVNREAWVSVRTHMVVTADSEDAAEKRAQGIKLAMDNTSIAAGVEQDIASSLLINGCLPFTPLSYERGFSRQRRMLSADAASIPPVGGTWEGFFGQKPYAMYFNRWGKPLLINPTLADANPNAVVVGGSGSGKSYFIHDLILQASRLPGIYQYLISIKDDYEWMASLMGKVYTFDVDNLPCINPFNGEPTSANRELWEAILVLTVTSIPGEVVSKEDRALLDKAALNCYHRIHSDTNGGGVMGIDEIALELLSLGHDVKVQAERLRNRMSDFLSQGKFHNLLNGRRDISIADKQIFFNLKGIMATTAGPIVLAALMRFFDEVITMPERRSSQKTIVFDEGAFLNDDALGAIFVSRAVRIYRSMGGQVIGVSQMIEDWQTGFGKAMLSNTASKYVLKQQTVDDYSAVATLLGLNEKEFALIASLRLEPGYYSEFFVKVSGAGATVGRVYAMPLLNAIATTDAPDFQPRTALLKKHDGDIWKATQEFAKTYPRGVRAHQSTGASLGLSK